MDQNDSSNDQSGAGGLARLIAAHVPRSEYDARGSLLDVLTDLRALAEADPSRWAGILAVLSAGAELWTEESWRHFDKTGEVGSGLLLLSPQARSAATDVEELTRAARSFVAARDGRLRDAVPDCMTLIETHLRQAPENDGLPKWGGAIAEGVARAFVASLAGLHFSLLNRQAWSAGFDVAGPEFLKDASRRVANAINLADTRDTKRLVVPIVRALFRAVGFDDDAARNATSSFAEKSSSP